MTIRRGRKASISWSNQPLGLISDYALAKHLGCSREMVVAERTARNIPACAQDTQEQDRQNRAKTTAWALIPWYWADIEIARVYGFDAGMVAKERKRMNAPPNTWPVEMVNDTPKQREELLSRCVLDAVFAKQPSSFQSIYNRVSYGFGTISNAKVRDLLAGYVFTDRVKVYIPDNGVPGYVKT